MWNYSGDPTDYLAAYRALAEINPSLANVSVSLIPNEMTLGTSPSLASDLLIYSKIPLALLIRSAIPMRKSSWLIRTS